MPELNNPLNVCLKCQQEAQSGEFMSVSCLFSHLLSAAWCESDSNGQEIAGQLFEYL